MTVGDVGYVDSDGYLYLTDRRHHMIISGGVNIYPQEAENALVSHPKVADAAVFGIPDEDMGQSVKAVVQLVDHADATDEFGEELLSWLRDRLAHFKCPRSISFEEKSAAHRHRQALQAESHREVLRARFLTGTANLPPMPGALKVVGQVLWRLRYDLLAVLMVALAMAMFSGSALFAGAAPAVPLLGVVVSIFIGFRNSSAYSRWWEARTL